MQLYEPLAKPWMEPNGPLGKPLMESNGRPEKPWMERDGRLAKWLKAQNGLQTASSTPQTGDSNLSKEKSRFFDHLCHHQRPPETPGVFVFIGALTFHDRFNADVDAFDTLSVQVLIRSANAA